MKKFVILFMLLLLSGSLFADNADLTPEEAYGRIFSPKTANLADYFDASFLKAIPVEKIAEIVKIYHDALGEYQKSETSSRGYKLLFARGSAPSTITIGSNNKISGLWFGAPELNNDDLQSIIKDFKALPGKVSVCLLKDNKEAIIEIESDLALGCGSSFKLFLLKALQDEIAAGKRSWTDLIEIKEELKSMPSGILQEWPAGSRHTLETIAGLMISISDNTATDHIYAALGGETVRKYLPDTCKDLYNTSQVLKLKFFFQDKARAYVKADEAGKKAILAEMDKNIPDQIASYANVYKQNTPFMIDEIEWFISTRKLCEVIFSLKENKLIRINPATGMVDKKDWHIAGFKGGSEPGVINLTWVLQKTPQSPVYTLSCTSNNSKEADVTLFNTMVMRLLKAIEKM